MKKEKLDTNRYLFSHYLFLFMILRVEKIKISEEVYKNEEIIVKIE